MSKECTCDYGTAVCKCGGAEPFDARHARQIASDSAAKKKAELQEKAKVHVERAIEQIRREAKEGKFETEIDVPNAMINYVVGELKHLHFDIRNLGFHAEHTAHTRLWLGWA